MDVIWERQIDPADQSARWDKFRKWFVAPAIALVAVVLITSGPGGALGALILVTIAGLLLVGYIIAKGIALSTARTVHRDGDEIVWGTIRVAVDQVAQWSTFIVPAGERRDGSRVRRTQGPEFPTGLAVFTCADGRTFEFWWPELTQVEIDELRDALTPHLGAPWIARPQRRR